MLVDANVLFLAVGDRFPLSAEVDRHRPGATLAVTTSVLRELDRLVARRVPRAAAARLLAERWPALTAPGVGDAALARAAVRTKAWVVTADRELRARLRSAGVVVLAPRDRHRLERWDPFPGGSGRRPPGNG